MNYTGSMILFIFLVQLAAYTLKWLIGFGNPLISAPLLAMRLDNTLITPGSLLPDLVINGRITWQNRNNFRWRAILPLLLAMVAGVVPGTWLLRFSLPWIIKTVLGGVVVFLGLEMATRRLRPVRPDRREIPWLRYLVAFFSGMCAGLFGINMFLVAYLQRTAKDYDEFKGSICFLFLGENLFRTGLYLWTGLLNRSSLCFSLISLAAAFCAARLARLLSPHISGERLQKLSIVYFLLGGVSIIVKSVLLHTSETLPHLFGAGVFLSQIRNSRLPFSHVTRVISSAVTPFHSASFSIT